MISESRWGVHDGATLETPFSLAIVCPVITMTCTIPRAVPNQRAIAEALGLNQTTVSLALRGHPRIPEATRERVRGRPSDSAIGPMLMSRPSCSTSARAVPSRTRAASPSSSTPPRKRTARPRGLSPPVPEHDRPRRGAGFSCRVFLPAAGGNECQPGQPHPRRPRHRGHDPRRTAPKRGASVF